MNNFLICYADRFLFKFVGFCAFLVRFNGNPSLADVRCTKPDWRLMGGINESIAKESDPLAIEAEIDDTFAQLDGRGFIRTPGCSLKTNIWEGHI